MKRIALLLCTLFFCTALFAQSAEESEEIQYQHEYEDQVQFIYSQNQEGDQYTGFRSVRNSPCFWATRLLTAR